MFIVGDLPLEEILSDIWYLSLYSSMGGEYLENLPVYEREFHMAKLLDKLRKDQETGVTDGGQGNTG